MALSGLILIFLPVVFSRVIQHDPALLELVELNATMKLLAEQKRAFAHEGAVWIAATNEVYFSSGRYVDEASKAQHVELMKIDLETNRVTRLHTQPELVMANGATLYSKHEVLFCSQGYNDTPGSLVIIDTRCAEDCSKLNATKLNLHPALNFNSINDVIISDEYDGYFFTDPYYGYASSFRSRPTLEQKIYFADRKSLNVTALDTFSSEHRPNGLVQSLDGTTLYVSETGFIIGNGTENPKIPRAIYAYNITKGSNGIPVLSNKRFFVENVDNGVADQIKLDEKGNLYAAVQDGVNVYAPSGRFLGKLAVPKGEAVPSFVWADKTLIILAETTIHSIPLKVGSAPLPGAKNTAVHLTTDGLAVILLGIMGFLFRALF